MMHSPLYTTVYPYRFPHNFPAYGLRNVIICCFHITYTYSQPKLFITFICVESNNGEALDMTINKFCLFRNLALQPKSNCIILYQPISGNLKPEIDCFISSFVMLTSSLSIQYLLLVVTSNLATVFFHRFVLYA